MLLVTHNVTSSRARHLIVIGYKILGTLASGCFPLQNNILAEFCKKIDQFVPNVYCVCEHTNTDRMELLLSD